MDALLETEPPFIIKVFNDHFVINWENSFETPDDSYYYSKISSIKIQEGSDDSSVEESALAALLYFFFRSARAGNKEFDEILITFADGKKETRYIQAKASEEIREAVQMINKMISPIAKTNQK